MSLVHKAADRFMLLLLTADLIHYLDGNPLAIFGDLKPLLPFNETLLEPVLAA